MRFLALWAVLLPANVWAQNLACNQINFGARIAGGQVFRHSLGSQLELVLDPNVDDEGWTLRVSPIGTSDDWTYPVNLPLSGEAQSLGSGWSMTAEDRLSGKRTFHFTLTSSDFVLYSKLAHDALHSSSPRATEDFIDQIGKARLGSIVLSEFSDENEGSPDKIKWVSFTAKITVPRSFNSHANLGWSASSCPRTNE